MSEPDDDASLRSARRARVFDAMDAAGLDAMVLGRRDDVAYASGARSLWTAGTRPFGAACVLVGDGRSVHLMSTWDAGVPPDVPFEHLYGLTWNPAKMGAALGAVPGLAGARRIGVDALSPGFAKAAGRLAPGAEVVPADDVVRSARMTKLPGELDRIRRAVGVAGTGVQALLTAVRDGGSHAEAVGSAIVTMAHEGVTTPAGHPVVRALDGGSSLHVDVSVLVDGYEGGLGRTCTAAGDDVVPEPHRSLTSACRAGATGADLRAAAAGASRWMVRGSGMGFEVPVVTAELGGDVRLVAGLVLSVETAADGAVRRDLLVVSEGEPTLF